MPCSFAALDKLRIEAGLLFYGYDMTEANTPYEVGLGFTVANGKNGYRGHQNLLSKKDKPQIVNVCLDIDHDEMLAGGELLMIDGRDVGVVNSPCYSRRLGKSLALAHVTPDACTPGTVLKVSSDTIACSATVVSSPIHDPDKSRTHAV